MAIVDFTNPEASKWYTSHLMRLMDMGVDSFKTDFAERIPFQNVKFHDGSDPVRMHNYYSILYNKAVYEAMISRVGKAKSLLFARSTAPGGQACPVHWGGDCESAFEAMAESLRGGLGLMFIRLYFLGIRYRWILRARHHPHCTQTLGTVWTLVISFPSTWFQLIPCPVDLRRGLQRRARECVKRKISLAVPTFCKRPCTAIGRASH